MCGIVGIHYRDAERSVEEQTIRRMCRAIRHRGPDGEGVILDGELGMGMRRLSIIDLEGGQQPIYNEDRSVAVVFNGEIFNYLELRLELESAGHVFRTQSDTETLVHGYESWGTDLPARLNGMFAFSIWDRRNRSLLIARDHLGIKPLYIHEDDHQLVWASEIKAILELQDVRAELDEQALLDYLRFGYVPGPRTMFKGIRKFEPAQYMLVTRDGTQVQNYWDVEFNEEHRSEDSWCEALQELVNDAVQRQLMSDVPLGAFLSGGIDSSSIVATMRKLGAEQISTYAIGFDGEDAFHSELTKAADVAQMLDTEHHEIVVEPNVADLLSPLIYHLDEPFTDTSFIVTYLVSELARETVKVILSGVGGDEIFAGYRRYLGPRLHNIYGLIPGPIRRQVIHPLLNRAPVDRGSRLRSGLRYARGFVQHAECSEPFRYQGHVGVYDNLQRASLVTPEFAELERGHHSNHVAEWYSLAPTEDPLNRMLYADIKTSLVDSLLAFTDKMSMAVSLEARVPLLDYRLVEMAASIPASLKLRRLSGMKHIFKRAMSDRLPNRITMQKKQGFGTPVSRWLRSDLRPLVDEYLSTERLAKRGYFKPAAVRQLISNHDAQRADYSEHILALLTLEMWHEAVLER